MSGALWLVEPPTVGNAVTVAGEMVVAVDQPWQERKAGAIDDLGGRRPSDGMTWPHGFNPPLVDEDGRIALGGRSSSIDNCGTDQELLHTSPTFLSSFAGFTSTPPQRLTGGGKCRFPLHGGWLARTSHASSGALSASPAHDA